MNLIIPMVIFFIIPKGWAGSMTISNIQVKKTVVKNRKDINECYQNYLAQGFDARGKAIFKWNIHPDGRATHVRAIRSIDSYIDRCIAKKIRTWKFPKTGNDQIAEVRFPFVFKNRIKK